MKTFNGRFDFPELEEVLSKKEEERYGGEGWESP